MLKLHLEFWVGLEEQIELEFRFGTLPSQGSTSNQLTIPMNLWKDGQQQKLDGHDLNFEDELIWGNNLQQTHLRVLAQVRV